jgi:tRNA-splicing ligase RtcB (3'-phosphate/5'-hydroxy nucleic acid ligase)
VGAGLSVFAGRLFWPIAILVLTLATPAFAGGIHVDLDCVPLPIANQPADRDPVAQINVRLDAEDGHFTLYVMHETVSGQKFSRMDQYRDIGLRHVGPVRDWSDVWQWYGGLIRNPRLDTPFAAIHDNLGEIIRDISRTISFGVGRTNEERVDAELFDDADAWRESDMESYRQKAANQLGTVGSGNHYVDVMRDEDGFAWIGVHFGSRGLGHTSAKRYLKAAGGKDGMNVPPAVIDEDSELGRRYIAAMQLAGRYAYAGREWVVERVRKIIGGVVTGMVHNHHNYAWRETHNGRDLWVVRKGATPAFPGQRGFVGGSMGDDAVIIEGVDSPEARASLYSTIHGAGRLFGRKEAKRRFTREQMNKWIQDRGVTLIGADLDESPMAYRRLPEVLAEHAGSVKVLHTLRPFAVAMAGDGETDPWKD